jgi:RNA polymerase sigma factor (sigma-70 family)
MSMTLADRYGPHVAEMARRQARGDSWLADDMAQEAALALLRLEPRYDPDNRCAERYVLRRARGAMIDYTREAGHWFTRGQVRQGLRMRSLDAPVPDRPDRTVASTLAARPEPPTDCLFWEYVCRGLSRAERLILTGYYLGGCDQAEIGAAIGCRQNRVSQILRDLHARLRPRLERITHDPT